MVRYPMFIHTKFGNGAPLSSEIVWVGIWGLLKTDENTCLIINNNSADCLEIWQTGRPTQ